MEPNMPLSASMVTVTMTAKTLYISPKTDFSIPLTSFVEKFLKFRKLLIENPSELDPAPESPFKTLVISDGVFLKISLTPPLLSLELSGTS